MKKDEPNAKVPDLPNLMPDSPKTICLRIGSDDGDQKEALITTVCNAGHFLIHCVGFHPPDPVVKSVANTLWKFSNECQLMYVLYHSVLHAQNPIQEHLGLEVSDDAYYVGFDEYNNSAGPHVYSFIPWKEVADAFSPNGLYETMHAKSFVIFAYQLWEEFARREIERLLEVGLNDVKSDLMGEWNHLRNYLVHPSKKNHQSHFNNVSLLPKLPNQSDPNNPVVTANMMKPLLNCLNSLHIVVNPNNLHPSTTLCPPVFNDMELSPQNDNTAPTTGNPNNQSESS